jgi:hypothetical protein
VNDALANLVLSLFDFSLWTNVVDDALSKLNYSWILSSEIGYLCYCFSIPHVLFRRCIMLCSNEMLQLSLACTNLVFPNRTFKTR